MVTSTVFDLVPGFSTSMVLLVPGSQVSQFSLALLVSSEVPL